ncbi:MAG: N-acetylmuramoyl-L-alanine amidase [Gammaproteobacteria bacterium]
MNRKSMFQGAPSRTFALLISLLASVAASASNVEGVRLFAAPDYTRLVLDLTGPVTHELSYLTEPDRVVIDIPNASMRADQLPAAQGFVSRIRSGEPKKDTLRVVLDMAQTVKPRSFSLRPNGTHGDRLVVDLVAPGSDKTALPHVRHDDSRDIVVAISPGHGGRDPGAIGPNGTREKDVVLAIAKRLKHHLDAQEGIRGELVRNHDFLVGYRDRMRFARDQKADLFVAIHADAFTDVRAHGSTVYILSERGASSEAARWLADKHNASELIGGVSLTDKDEVLASVLLDLSQSASLGASMAAGDKVIAELGKVGRVRKKRVQQAGFLVLKSPDIPSILVETAFISNPKEEKRLRNPKDQDKWGGAIANGIVRYFAENPPPDTLFASRYANERPEDLEYIISRGDTLSDIADRFNVPLSSLRRANAIRGDRIRIGQVLKIPNSRG